MEEADFFQGGDGGGGGGRGFTDFSDDVGLGPPPQHMGSPFRGGRGGGPWRGGGGRGGRGGGHFDNGFGPRGPPPRGFRGGRGGFGGPPGGPNMRGGSPGPRGFRGGGGGHFERGGSPYRYPPGGPGGWNGPPPFQMGPGGGGPPMENPNESESGQQIWAETKTDTGSSYYYNTKTRITTWDRPEGPNVTVMSHEEWTGMIKGQGVIKGKFGGSQENQDNAAAGAGQNQSSSPNQGAAGSDENGIRPTEPKQLDAQMRNPPPMLGPNPGQPMPPGFPPFGGMSVPPPFGMNFPQNFPMVPPPWNPMSGAGPPPVGVPPLLGPGADPILQHVDPLVVARAFEWSEHYSPDGKPYYFNAKTQTSVWVKPMPMIELDNAKVIAQQRITQQNMINATKEKERNEKHGEYRERAEAATKKLLASSNDKGKPISSTPVTGTPWCIVWTGDKRVFFYNPSTKSSVWERPPELAGRHDVEELLSTCPAVKAVPALPVKKAEATSTSESSSANSAGAAGAAAAGTGSGTSAGTASFSITISPSVASLDLTPKPAGVVGEKRSLDGTEPPGEAPPGEAPPPEKKIKTDSQEDDNEDEEGGETETQDKEIITIEDKDDKDTDKDAPNSQGSSTLEFEVKAARERAIVPLETRLQQFKEMLIEKQVSAFSTWEKELHKIVFDSRYLLLTSKERKAAFDDYVKERAFEERKEKKARLAQVKERFMKFLENVHVHPKMSYNELSQKYSRDERYKSVEKSRDRESYLSEYIAELKKKEKDARKMEKDKVKDDFLSTLQKSISDYHMAWEDAREIVDSSRFDALGSDEKAELFRSFRKQLKVSSKSRDRKKKKSKREKRKREEKKQKGADAHGGKDTKTTVDDNGEIVEEEGTTPDSEKAEGGESDKVEDISDEEEGAITDDTEDEDRIKKEKAQISIREREKEVQRTLATHLRDRDKERDYYRHEEAVQECQALLTDLVKLSETTWKDAKKAMKKDRRWEPISFLEREEVELLFNQHLENIEKKKKFRFRELLRENRVKLNSSWKETRRKIREDPRFNKFSTDDRKCEREFTLYLKDLVTTYKSDFRMLLKETKMLTYKTKHLVRENPQMMRDIEAVLEKDKRFLNLETMTEERHRLIVDYIEELGRQGPPPPPTAPDKVSRRLK